MKYKSFIHGSLKSGLSFRNNLYYDKPDKTRQRAHKTATLESAPRDALTRVFRSIIIVF